MSPFAHKFRYIDEQLDKTDCLTYKNSRIMSESEMIVRQLMNGMEDILVPLGVCVVLPVMLVWLVMRHKTNETNRRTEIVLAAIKNNSDIDVEEFLKKLNPPQKSVKEKLMQKLMCASVLTAIGLFFGGYAMTMGFIGGFHPEKIELFGALGGFFLLVGLSLLIVCLLSKKVMAKELEAENNRIEQ